MRALDYNSDKVRHIATTKAIENTFEVENDGIVFVTYATLNNNNNYLKINDVGIGTIFSGLAQSHIVRLEVRQGDVIKVKGTYDEPNGIVFIPYAE